MSILGNTPNLSTMRTLVEGLAYSNQIEIPVPGGFNSGMLDVVVGGADLGMADYDDSNGMSVKLKVPMSTGTQFKIVAWTPNQTVVNAGGQLAGSRNRIINGDCRIAQRASFAFTNGVGGYGGPDRFSSGIGGAGGQFTQSQASITVNGAAKWAVKQNVDVATTAMTGTNYWAGITQIIEGFNCHDLLGQPVVVSFWFLTNISGTFSVAVRDGTPALSHVSTFTAQANVPLKVIIPVATIPLSAVLPSSVAAGLGILIGAIGGGGATVLNSWQSGSLFFASGSTNWAATVGNYIAVTDLQLEPGSLATSFESRPYGTELLLCQRYFQADQVTFLPSRTDFHSPFMLKTPMRSSPSVFWKSSVTLANGFLRDNDNARDVPVTSGGGTPTFIYPVTGSTPTMAVNSNTTVNYTAHADF